MVVKELDKNPAVDILKDANTEWEKRKVPEGLRITFPVVFAVDHLRVVIYFE